MSFVCKLTKKRFGWLKMEWILMEISLQSQF